MVCRWVSGVLAGVLAVQGFCGMVIGAENEDVYCFSPGDFAQETVLAGVCITDLPEEGQGVVMLGSRRIRAGDVLTARQLAEMVFLPVEDCGEIRLRYIPVSVDGISQETTVVIPLASRKDQAPAAEDSAAETYKNLPCEGLLMVTDPEEQELTFTLTRKPRRGSVILREDGSFLYTPEKNKVGTDSFTYTASDPAGNVSRQATVIIRILKPGDDYFYSDTVGLSCRFEAEWLRSQGIFTGEQVSGQLCFSPTEGVNRGQFLVMLMDTLGLPKDRSGAVSADAPGWLAPYLGPAVRAGIVEAAVEDVSWTGLITGGEASGMVSRALAFSVPASVDPDGAIAAWARAASAEYGGGLNLPEGGALVTRADAAKLLYRISKIQEQAPAWFFGN